MLRGVLFFNTSHTFLSTFFFSFSMFLPGIELKPIHIAQRKDAKYGGYEMTRV